MLNNQKLKLKWWWYLAPAYLTLWTVAFSAWSLVDGQGMLEAFGVATGSASEFVLLNSGARYVAIAVGMVVGIWWLRSFGSILTALLVRLAMDLLDIYAGITAGIITDATGVIQGLLMFVQPNLIAIITLIRLTRASPTANQ